MNHTNCRCHVLVEVEPVPCAHIADYYRWVWDARPSIGSKLLMRGYAQWSFGLIEEGNNLYGP